MQQKWRWDYRITELVRSEFDKKAMKRLSDQVGRWKKKWKDKGDKAMPHWFNPRAWAELVAYWSLPESDLRSIKCSTSRMTKVDGKEIAKHTSGQFSFRKQAKIIMSWENEDNEYNDYIRTFGTAAPQPRGGGGRGGGGRARSQARSPGVVPETQNQVPEQQQHQ